MDMNYMVGETDTKHRQEIRDQFARAHRAQKQSRFRHKFFSGLRRVFIFLLLAAIVTFAVWQWNEVNQMGSLATKKIGAVVNQLQTKSAADPLRQNALKYQQEVESVVGN